jgi:hypothetical protein
VQRPSTLPPAQPSAPPPTPVDTPPVTTPPVESPPQPIEVATQPEPTPAPVPQVAAPPPTLPPVSDPFDAEPPPRERQRPISPMFRRPGVWLGTGLAAFGVSALLRFIFPTVTKSHNRCVPDDDCPDHEMNGGGWAIVLLTAPLDALSFVSFGFAGRSYGLQAARRSSHPRRAPFVGGGAALVIAGAALTVTAVVLPVVRDTPDVFSYEVAAIRQAGVAAVSGGAFLLGYGIAQPYDVYARAPAQRRLAIAPTLGRTHVGLSLTFMR